MKDIINSNLIYRSAESDAGLRAFSLITRSCIIRFYREYDISKFDLLICEILSRQESNYLKKEDLGFKLGFDVIDNPSKDSFYDKAEDTIFTALLKDCIDWGLVEEKNDVIQITSLGLLLLETKKKYKFFEAQSDYYEFQGLRYLNDETILSSECSKELDIELNLGHPKELSYDINSSDIITNKTIDEVVSKLQQQAAKDITIYYVQRKPYIGNVTRQLDVELYRCEETYHLYFSYQGEECTALNEIFDYPINSSYKERKVEWALYSKILNDDTAKLNYEVLSPFEDILDIEDLITDKRIVWTDEKLLNLIISRCSADDWANLSQFCDIGVLERIVSEHKDKLDWSQLTIRMSDQFIKDNSSSLPWETRLLVARDPVSPSLIQHFLEEYDFPEGKDDDNWNWDEIVPIVGLDYVKENIQEIPFDLSLTTQNIVEDVKNLIKEYPQATWDWTFISSYYPLDFIIEHITDFSSYLSFSVVLDRIFIDETYAKIGADSEELSTAVINNKTQIYSVNSKSFIWYDCVISFFESVGLINWASGNFSDGFVQNRSLIWDFGFFSKYKSRLSNLHDKDYEYLSSNIKDIKIIESYPSFKWDWKILSKNFIVYENVEFVKSNIDKIDKQFILLNCSKELVQDYYLLLDANQLMITNDSIRSKVTDSVSIDFIRTHITDQWDWSLLTKRVYKSINISLIGNDIWREKWDWSFLSSSLSIDDIIQYAEQYADKWNWNIILRRLPEEKISQEEILSRLFSILSQPNTYQQEWEYLSSILPIDIIINNAIEYSKYWSWEIVLNRMTSQDLPNGVIELLRNIFDNSQNNQMYFKTITSKFSTSELIELIEQYSWHDYPWNLEDLYSRNDFDAKSYLKEHLDSINWDVFSLSSSVNKLLKKKKKTTTKSLWLRIFKEEFLLNNQYKWNFFNLTKLSNIISEPRFFELNKEWDWEYISQYAQWLYTTRDDEQKKSNYFFKKYAKKLSFDLLSSRTDIGLTEQIIKDYNNFYNWNWKTLIENSSIDFSFEFIEEFIDKPWDWKHLSTRDDLKAEIVNNHKDKAWDWFIISSKPFFSLSVDDISHIISLGNSLDWDSISTNPNLKIETIKEYHQYINWNLLIERNPAFENIADISFLKEFENEISWKLYNFRIGSKINNELLENFHSHLDWENVSKSQHLDFTIGLIRKYEKNWFWNVLFNNPKFKEDIPDYENQFSSYKTVTVFVNRLKKANHGITPHIYHFTHLYNAIDIIRSRKILSRDRAEELGLLRFDSAGSVVQRSNLAHPYARFYFRPCTPTQYYNEALGADSELGKFGYGRPIYDPYTGEKQFPRIWKSKYPKAVQLGLPKCPIPVFFRFDVEEVLANMLELCSYSDRNMQSNNPCVYKLQDNPNSLGVDYLYDTIETAKSKAKEHGGYDQTAIERYMKYSQQEFLVYKEFDFSALNSFLIICYDKEYTKILRQIFADDPICEKIVSANEVDEMLFENENRKVELSQQMNTFILHTNFRDDYYFKILSQNLKEIDFDLSESKVISESTTELLVKGIIKWESTSFSFDIYFVDPKARTKEWLIYCNSDVPSMNTSKFTLDNYVSNYLDIFYDSMNTLPIQLSIDLFYPHMINSYHGIGHTSRVLFLSFLLAKTINLTEEETNASCIAAITHDIGKRGDLDGASHGLESMLRVKDQMDNYIKDVHLSKRVLNAVRYHSVEDKDCPNEVQQDVIWKLLKDADALDRSRFSNKGCDKSYLRLGIYNTPIGQNIIDLASYLPSWTQNLNWDNPYQELIDVVYKYCK